MLYELMNLLSVLGWYALDIRFNNDMLKIGSSIEFKIEGTNISFEQFNNG
jgi:hypothetical protein